MNADLGQVVLMLAAVNVAAMFVLVVLSFGGSALALDGLEKLDVWLRHHDERRPLASTEKMPNKAPEPTPTSVTAPANERRIE